MVLHSIHPHPEQNEIYEFTKFEISKAFYTPDHSLIEHVEATVTTFFPFETDLTRLDIIEFMKKSGNGFYLDGHKLLLEVIEGKPFIHIEPGKIPRDILA